MPGARAASVNLARCRGCGACLEACPTGAILLVESATGGAIASIDPHLCDGCGACVEICPREAIEMADIVSERAPVVRTESTVGALVEPTRPGVLVEPPRAAPTRRWLSAAGVALSFVAREIVPRAVDALLQSWDRKRAESRQVGALDGSGLSVGRGDSSQPVVPTVISAPSTLARGRQNRGRHRHGRNG